MPGTEVVNKQHTLGGVIGIAVLLMALGYRFYPDILHVAQQEQQVVETTEPEASPWVVSQPAPSVDGEGAARPPPYAGTTEADALAMGPPTPVTREIGNLLRRARTAEERGQVLEPADRSAVALYRAVLERDARNTEARTGLARIAGAIRDWALAAIERNDDESARKYVGALVDLPHADKELAMLQSRLATLAQVQPLLARAAQLLKQGRRVGDGDDNALAAYRAVVAIDPQNRIADQGLAQIERDYLDRALAAAAQDSFADADRILSESTAVRPGSAALQDTRSRIEGLRSQRAESVLNQARSALDSGNPDLGEQLAQQAQQISPDLAGLGEFAQRLRNARLYARFKPGQTVNDGFLAIAGSAPTVVVIPTGSFVMGSAADEEGHRDNEEPQRRVSVTAGFAIGQTEVTVAQFRDFVRQSGYITDAERIGAGSIYDESSGRMTDRRGIDWKNDYRGERAGDNLPVINVSWNDAIAYARWLSEQTGQRYRLPSEAEFEYVLRAGTQSRFPWGDANPDRELGNLTGEGDRSPSKRSWARAFPNYGDGHWGPAPVRSYEANAFGVHDMVGNVAEWVQDCWHDNYVRAPRDSGPWDNPGCLRRLLRGGAWGSSPDQSRSAYRLPVAHDMRSAQVGFRIARDL